jgi:hypothetical protein
VTQDGSSPIKPHGFRRLSNALRWTVVLVGAAAAVAGSASAAPLTKRQLEARACPAGYLDAQLSWGEKCLRTGEYCKVGNIEYHAYGFDCPASGLLTFYSGKPAKTAASSAPSTRPVTALAVGKTVLVARRTRASNCTRGPTPDRRCSPGAYYAGLTRNIICSPNFRTSAIRNVPQSEKFQVEREYGMPASYYGRTIEIDHIVSLELGGSNDQANLFPEPGSGGANYHVKDTLENKLHDLVCAGTMNLRAAQRQIAANWEALYRKVFGVAP